MDHLTILLLAFMLEAALGYPDFIYRRIKHPVVWMGAVIAFMDKNCNRRKFAFSAGILTVVILLAATLAASLLISRLGGIAEIIAIASLLACRSLYDHVNAVYKELQNNNLPAARAELAKIVGRDTNNLNESETGKAAIESLAESFSDGVVAPLFWAIIFGLPGIACYKAINTADSMIGHRTEVHEYFGKAAARLDDAANFIPARISALLILLSSLADLYFTPSPLAHPPFTPSPLAGDGRGGGYIESTPTISPAPPPSCTMRCGILKKIITEAKKHASPNSGYPESAMAFALKICLGGECSYDGKKYSAPEIGADMRKEITASDLQNSLKLYVSSCLLLFLFLLGAKFL